MQFPTENVSNKFYQGGQFSGFCPSHLEGLVLTILYDFSTETNYLIEKKMEKEDQASY